ncbi:MAG: M48 family metallopeptidase [Armatimonadota bacterium]
MNSGFGRRIARPAFLVIVLLLGVLARAEDIGRLIEKQFGLYGDFAANYRVQTIGQRIALAAELTGIRFEIINDGELNAMALPDGRIYVTSAMATLVSDDELAFVLGHEVTHVKEKHAQKQQQQAMGGALLGAIIVAVFGGGESAIRTGADIAGGLTYGQYSRRDEKRADDGGIHLMTRCGYQPRLAAEAMQRLIDAYGRGDANVPVLGWFATHPDTKTRKERLLARAAVLEKQPPPPIAGFRGVQIIPDASAEHASSWLPYYLAVQTAASSGGRATYLLPREAQGQYILPAPAVTAAPVTPELPPASTTNRTSTKDKPKKPFIPPTVLVRFPQATADFSAVISLREIPAGGAAELAAARGTAVEATLRWTQHSTGFTGACVGSAQTRDRVPWTAHEQLPSGNGLHRLSDGQNANLDGTLEAIAVRRAVSALAEVVAAGGPVDHSMPVTIPLGELDVRKGDYVGVFRQGRPVAEVRVEQVNNGKITGAVLWGAHTWLKKDQFLKDEG